MSDKEIPLLKSSDIECRVQQVRKTYSGNIEAVLLLYKDARCDMKYLDMLFGVTGWQRKHTLIGDRLYCTVEIWDSEKKMWIAKEDVGTESNTEKEKGQASDSFKRACFNIGIGRELYTAPSIKIELNDREWSEDKGRYKTFATFSVSGIEYDDERNISRLTIVDRFGNVRFTHPDGMQNKQNGKQDKKETKLPDYRAMFIKICEEKGIDSTAYAKEHGINKKTTQAQFKEIVEQLSQKELSLSDI